MKNKYFRCVEVYTIYLSVGVFSKFYLGIHFNTNEYSLLSPTFKIFISKFYNFEYKFDNHWKKICP